MVAVICKSGTSKMARLLLYRTAFLLYYILRSRQAMTLRLPIYLPEGEKQGHSRSQAVVVPPINFAMVAPGIYRSGHPNKKNLGFLRGLGLKGIM